MLLISTSEFKIHGTSYSGFPLLLNDSTGKLIPEVLDFLVYHLIERGRVASKQSWMACGQSMYDYWSFIEANDLNWKAFEQVNPVVFYRDWNLSECGLKPSTVNYRLRFISQFYRYALKQQWIESLPFSVEEVRVTQPKGFLAHVDVLGGRKTSTNILLKQPRTVIKVLNKAQIEEFLATIKNTTHKLIARLALTTGLRREELVTFPAKYVFNPASHNISDACDSMGQAMIRLRLEPSDMKLKGSQTRKIDVPVNLMADLWQYVINDRNQLEMKQDQKQSTLFLNTHGVPFAHSGRLLNVVWKKLPLSFEVSPHILRHTFATHTLYNLRQRQVAFDPLLYVRDRLGHSSITTTEKYLHLLDEVEDQLMNEYQQMLDEVN